LRLEVLDPKLMGGRSIDEHPDTHLELGIDVYQLAGVPGRASWGPRSICSLAKITARRVASALERTLTVPFPALEERRKRRVREDEYAEPQVALRHRSCSISLLIANRRFPCKAALSR
jgi:hypothetical protein